VPLAGIVTPAAYERLVRARPQVRDAFDVVRVEPMDEPRTLALAARAEPATDRVVLREALALSRHFLGDAALPGALLSLLQTMRRRRGPGDDPLTLADALATISERSGLPPLLLDERERLDVDKLRAFFAARVIGQPEAVECMVERVALVKAGLTDPTRPQAVLLFVGPTGTGKTEIAKTLAEFLFGSPDRMIRLDMSEYQLPGSAYRMLGDFEGDREDASLVARIRRQPFSVVLLDEFEKADPSVWDLFLQVFDDGRLSDPRGAVADFRHAVIVMTSNLGAKIPTGSGIGFSPDSGFAAGSVEQAVTRAFRREFLNRIDRVVVFRPLSRPVMREILTGELDAVLARRGLRGRQWAVEFDDSALEFLLAQGFTPDLGARPLKRAVERHFLTPLALAIAAHEYPSGDQFLFVRAKGAALEVTFEDPDAPEPAAPAPPEATLRTLAREGRPGLALLEDAFDSVSARVGDTGWQDQKAALLARTGEPGFWDDDGRAAVLGGVELRDRIEAGLRSAGSLMARLRGAKRPPAALVRRAAQRLLLLDEALDALAAGEPADARLKVEGDPEFGPRITAMYRTWAHERGMRLQDGEERGGRRYRWSASVSGFAALRVLTPENGFHVLEIPDGRGGYDRHRVRVTVTPDDGSTPASGGRATIVRRYRERPTPLVRDAVRGWRTGRLDAVLAGGFDLVE
jgi:ATP-dependent Clp protease ATP-binding subunit ClpC